MPNESTFRVQAPRVVHEVFDEEVVVLDLTSGSYYSLRESAAWIFQAAAAGASSRAIAAAFPARGHDAAASVRPAVDAFLDALVSEGLLARQPDAAAPPARLDPPEDARSFTLPRFEKFTDMQDLLLLDPIHDVDESGWPRAAAKAGGSPK